MQMTWMPFFLLLGALAAFSVENHSNLVLHFFGSPTCKDCMEIKERILFPAQKAHADIIQLHIHDVDTDSGFNLLMQMEETYGVTASAAIELYFPDTFLTGKDDIKALAGGLIGRHLSQRGIVEPKPAAVQEKKDFGKRLGDKFQSYAFISILVAGILDGVNPCAIATMIFLISFLTLQKRKRSEVLVIGLLFTAAVFATYLLLGVGAFKALTFLKKYLWVSQAVRWSAVALAAGAGLYSFRDAWVYRKTGRAQDIKLQLPTAIKLRIHRVISGQLSGRSLVLGAVVMGFLVTLLEAVCTGQMYLPTIILMTRQEGLRLTGWLYLLFYNFLFVLPLLIVMILAYFGMTWDRLARLSRKRLTLIKVLFGLALFGLAAFLAVSG